MKKNFLVLTWLFLFQTTAVFASLPANQVTLKVQFDSAPNKPFYDQPLHIEKIVSIDPNAKTNNVVMTQTKIVDNSPVTLALLVKYLKAPNDAAFLHFNFMQYGFNEKGTIITQPQIILKNGQKAEIKFGAYKLKVLANWTDS